MTHISETVRTSHHEGESRCSTVMEFESDATSTMHSNTQVLCSLPKARYTSEARLNALQPSDKFASQLNMARHVMDLEPPWVPIKY